MLGLGPSTQGATDSEVRAKASTFYQFRPAELAEGWVLGTRWGRCCAFPRPGPWRSAPPSVEPDDAARDCARDELGEAFVDLLKAVGAADEGFEIDPLLQVEVR
jgi:hypothetical protein